VRHTGPQIDPLALLPGGAPLPVESPYELHIEFTGTTPPVASPCGDIDPDSTRAGVGYARTSALVRGDRWELEAELGASYFEDLRTQAAGLHFTGSSPMRAGWPPPSWATRCGDPAPARGPAGRQRQDLMVDPTGGTGWRARSARPRAVVRISLTAEVGIQRRDLFAISQRAIRTSRRRSIPRRSCAASSL